MADGTAQKCGRVGSCHIYLLKPFTLNRVKGFFMRIIFHFHPNTICEILIRIFLTLTYFSVLI